MAHVLIIDRDKHLIHLVQTFLAPQGLDVSAAHRGDQGMAQALKTKPDLILLDVNLPDSTGFQICIQLRRNQQTQAIPIILMSSLARYANQQTFALERGANEYISKPLKIAELAELVDKYVRPKLNSSSKSDYRERESVPVREDTSTAARDLGERLKQFLMTEQVAEKSNGR